MKHINLCFKKEVDHVEFMREYNKKYREQHSNLITCNCGSVIKQISKYTHSKSAKHQEYLKEAFHSLK
jgi:hypothetical protein